MTRRDFGTERISTKVAWGASRIPWQTRLLLFSAGRRLEKVLHLAVQRQPRRHIPPSHTLRGKNASVVQIMTVRRNGDVTLNASILDFQRYCATREGSKLRRLKRVKKQERACFMSRCLMLKPPQRLRDRFVSSYPLLNVVWELPSMVVHWFWRGARPAAAVMNGKEQRPQVKRLFLDTSNSAAYSRKQHAGTDQARPARNTIYDPTTDIRHTSSRDSTQKRTYRKFHGQYNMIPCVKKLQ